MPRPRVKALSLNRRFVIALHSPLSGSKADCACALRRKRSKAALPRLAGRFLFAVLRRRRGFQRMQEPACDTRDFLDRGTECFFVRLGRLIEARDLAHEL